ncbi:MAG: Flp pilus assembly protein CpaB [Rhodomicrobium sp.]|jgi:pilus assembly protein CpaB
MFFRNVLFILGAFCILGSMAFGYLWFVSQGAPAEPQRAAPAPAPARVAILTAAHAAPAGTLLQPEDIAWKQIEPQELKPGNMVRGQVAESEFLGASTRRDLANGEPLAASDLLKLSDRRFLAAVLKPGARAISISVDAAQSASGLILPGNHVDVILTQNLGEVTGEGKRKVVAETILQDVRVIAVDQAINPQGKAPAAGPQYFGEARMPKTVTLELTKRQAEMVFVALQLGFLQLAVRPLEDASSAGKERETAHYARPTYGTDVSPALSQTAPVAAAQPSASSLESQVRRAPAS